MKLSSLTRTRGGRVLLATVPTVAALAFLGGGVAPCAVPVSLAVSGQQFKIAADKLEGTGFSQYAGQAIAADKKTVHPAAIANIADAKLYNLCQSVKLPGLPISLLIHAGTDPKNPVTATDLQIGMDRLAGDATFNAIRIGVDASKVHTKADGDQGDFAMDADTVTINDLQQVSWSTQAAGFRLTDLQLGINMKGEECF
jgi:hypothetical protein